MEKTKNKNKIKRRIFAFFLALCTLTGSLFGEVCALQTKAAEIYQQEETEGESSQSVEEIKESTLYAQSAVLMDAESGRVLYGKNEKDVLPMASTTKIMTLLVALEEGNLSDVVTVSSYAASMPDVQLNIREGEQYYLKDLLYSLMLESHNDSAVAIAECVAGNIEGFAQKMNQKAKEIGCENTTFITPNGLDATATMTGKDGKETEVFHSTTAEDLAKIMSYCITEAPCKEQFLEITRTQEYTFSDCSGSRSFSCRNHNSFLHMMEGALSGKTGFTGKAGYCYVGALERDGKTFVVSLLACGWPNNKTYKWKDTRKLMEYGIENYEFSYYGDAAKEIPKDGQITVINGQTKRIGETPYVQWERMNENPNGSEDIQKMEDENEETVQEKEAILLRRDEKMEVKWEVEKELEAPVKAGTQVGYIQYIVGDEIYKEEKIVLKHDVEKIDYDWCLYRVLEKFQVF